MGPVNDEDLIPLRPAFDIVRRGYHRAQVDERLDELLADLRIVLADREAGAAQAAELARQLEAARQELDEARYELARLSLPPDTVEGLSPRLQRMLKLAQDEAAEITAQADAAAAKRMLEVENQANDLRTRYAEMTSETQRRRAEMEAEHQAALAQVRKDAEHALAQAEQAVIQAQQQAAHIVEQARQQAAELDAESAAQRRQVEEDFEITMSARRIEAGQMLAEQEANSKAEAKRRIAEADRRITEATDVARRVVKEADQRATGILAEATQGVEQLRKLRDEVAEQLTAARLAIDNTLQQLEPLPGERSPATGTRS